MSFRLPYDRSTQERVQYSSALPSRTKQSMAGETDINFIVNRFQKTGVIAHQARYEGQYGEFEPIDFHEAMNIVASATEMFAALPSNVRAQFANDPGAFLDFANNPDNSAALQSMGLGRTPVKPAEPAPVPVPEEPEG